MKYEKIWVGIIFIILAIIFTLDDATGIGQLADPIEFIIQAIVGYASAKILDE